MDETGSLFSRLSECMFLLHSACKKQLLFYSPISFKTFSPQKCRSAQQAYPYSTLLVKRRCALKIHFNNDRCGKGVPIETYLSLYNFPETTPQKADFT